MKSVTIEQIKAWGPCGLHWADDGANYTPQRIQRLVSEYGDGERITAMQAAAIPRDVVSAEDIVWFLLHEEIVTEYQMHLLACEIAESVVHFCDHPSAQAAIDAKRAWLRGEISDDELVAARAAAGAAAGDLFAFRAGAAARAAAGAAAGDLFAFRAGAAAWSAAGAAAGDAAWLASRFASATLSWDTSWEATRGAHVEMILRMIK